jgi:hypothetical protein
MSVTAILLLCLGSLVLGGVGSGVVVHRVEQRQAEATEAEHAQALNAKAAEVAALTGDLGECRARVTAESVGAAATGTTEALGAALAPGLAEVGARADLVRSLPRLEVTRALLEVASPRLLAAEQARLGCEAVGATGDSARLGCAPGGPVLTAWAAAVEAQAGCPGPAPVP